jgi:serine/threonine-protein kinase
VLLFPAPIFAATIMVPRLLDMDEGDAIAQIRALNLRIGDVDTTRHPVADRGSIIWQDPPPGVGLPEGTEVHLTVSGGPQRVPVPDLVGYTDELADRLVTAAGLRIRAIESTQAPAPRGVVVATRPTAGTVLTPGGEITLVVSVGAPTIRVPDLAGLTREEAEAALEAVGLVLGPTTRRRSSDGLPDTVLEQDPAPGTLSAPGAAIEITVARGGDS